MPIQIANRTGDTNAVQSNFVGVYMQLADSATTLLVMGGVKAKWTDAGGQSTMQTVNGTLAAPAVPGSGTNYSVVYASLTTGTLGILTVTTSIAAALAAVPAGNIALFVQALPTGATTTLSLQGGWQPVPCW